jgi:hypothetical protein
MSRQPKVVNHVYLVKFCVPETNKTKLNNRKRGEVTAFELPLQSPDPVLAYWARSRELEHGTIFPLSDAPTA